MSSWQLPTITEHQPHPLYQLTIPMGSLALQDTHTHTPHSLPDASVSGGRLGEARQQVWFHSAVLWDLPHLFSSVSEAPSLPPLPSLSTASQRSLAGPNCLHKEVGRSVSVGSRERLCVCVFSATRSEAGPCYNYPPCLWSSSARDRGRRRRCRANGHVCLPICPWHDQLITRLIHCLHGVITFPFKLQMDFSPASLRSVVTVVHAPPMQCTRMHMHTPALNI